MLRRHRQLRTHILQFLDGAFCALSLWVAHFLRFQLSKYYAGQSLGVGGLHYLVDPIQPFFQGYFLLFLVIIPLAPLVLEAQGFYKRAILGNRSEMLWQLAKACTFNTVGLILVLYMVHIEVARGVVVLFGVFSFITIALKEQLLRLVYRTKFGQAQLRRRIILVGAKADTNRLRNDITKASEELEVVAEFDLNETPIESLVTFLHEHSVNGVILSAQHTLFGKIEKAIQACELEGVEAWLVADFFKTQISQTSLDEFYGRPVLVFHSNRETPWRKLVKQTLDFFGATVLLLIFSPVMIGAAIAVKMTSPGPIFFRQQRSGVNGKPFTMYKFRSMGTDAEQRKQELAALNEMSGPVFKVSNDPRVTKVGAWLRKFSIDEFPQLLNVLRGEMSLVGPRPLPVDEVARFDDLAHRRRLSVKPGLTCLWQISGRSDLSDFREWVRLDLEYIDNWSLWLDFKILCYTIPVVMFGKGAR
jgi:exopolysaccharide biosynthesis polyprenyl glycosylphosphotransferase